MKTKIKLTPLFSSIIQSIAIISLILFLAIGRKDYPPKIIVILIFFIIGANIIFSLYCLLIAIFTDDEYHEECYGVLRYRVAKEKISRSDTYYIQAKPLFPLFFLYWKGSAYSKFLYKKDGEQYLCNNAFESKEEAYHQIEILKKRKEFKRLFLVKKIEVCRL